MAADEDPTTSEPSDRAAADEAIPVILTPAEASVVQEQKGGTNNTRGGERRRKANV